SLALSATLGHRGPVATNVSPFLNKSIASGGLVTSRNPLRSFDKLPMHVTDSVWVRSVGATSMVLMGSSSYPVRAPPVSNASISSIVGTSPLGAAAVVGAGEGAFAADRISFPKGVFSTVVLLVAWGHRLSFRAA